MADITRRLGWRHLRGAPTAHVRHHRSGRLVHDGPGLSFWYRALHAALSEVPVDDRELAMTFHARTSDFQDVAVQATVTYRIGDPALAAGRLDFSVDPDTGVWRGAPLEQLGTLLTETAQQHALDVLARTTLASALVDGVAAVRERVASGLAAEPRLPATGIEVVAVRVVALRPEPEVERALRTPAREQVQQEADRATYERRAVAVERERAIAENELASRIELARREEQLVDQRGTNARREAEEKAAADAVRAEAEAARTVRLADAEAARTVRLAEAEATRAVRLAGAEAQAAREVGEARARAQEAWLRVHADVDVRTLHALTGTRLAENLPRIGSVTVSPDVLTGLLTRLGGAEALPGDGPGAGGDPGAGPGSGPGTEPGGGPGAVPGSGPGAGPGDGPGSGPGGRPGAGPGGGPGAEPGRRA
ncbi:SPFH domain-containing protein [Streptomyces sp. NPDC059785]|uniref:SPFH domain-containing protein n=1 Tax=Streptomyces sp. NPDC059785 TaxID=3346945 RepID=UPI00364E6F5C